MKYAVFALAFIVLMALGASARSNPRLRYGLCVAMGFTPVLAQSINFVSHEFYRGCCRGYEVTLADLVCWSALLAVPAPKPKGAFPLAPQIALYVVVGVASSWGSEVPLYSYFGVWKMIRGGLMAWAAFRIAMHEELTTGIVRGLYYGAIYASLLAIRDRYLWGMIQSVGAYPHPNGLAMAENLVFPIALGQVLLGSGRRLELATVLFGPLALVLALSRGGLALFVMAAVITYLISLSQKVSARKMGFLALGLFGACAVLIKALDTIIERFVTASAKSAEARVEFEDVGHLMQNDFPLLGVGPNMYSYQSQFGGYGDRVGLVPMDVGGVMHNIYQLTRSEMGVIGYFAFLALVFTPLLLGVLGYLKDKDLSRKNLILGCTVGVGITLIHGNLEWSLRTAQMGSLFWVAIGLLSGLYKRGQVTGWKKVEEPSV